MKGSRYTLLAAAALAAASVPLASFSHDDDEPSMKPLHFNPVKLRRTDPDAFAAMVAARQRLFGPENVDQHFRFFDTICGATQDRQDALEKLLQQPLDLLLVIGGYNSSNTSHLAQMGEAKLPTYFIKNAAKMVSETRIKHFDLHKQAEVESESWLPAGAITVGITAGASCPNNLIEDVIRRLFELKSESVQELLS